MPLLFRTVAFLCLALLLPAADRGHFNIPLWEPGKVPLAKGNGPLDNPFLTVFLPPENKRNGASVVVAPGGGDIMLMYGAEGFEVAERFNDWGAAAFVLTYRLVPYSEEARALDGNRAIQIIRSRAKEWKLDPNKIGFAGFSAGSSLARAVVNGAKPGEDTRPNYLVMVYSAGRAAPNEDLKSFPPTFLLVAAHDRGNADSNARLFLDMNRAGTVVEAHFYQKGRHGFGAAFGSPEFSPWMDALKHFLVQGGFLPKGK